MHHSLSKENHIVRILCPILLVSQILKFAIYFKWLPQGAVLLLLQFILGYGSL